LPELAKRCLAAEPAERPRDAGDVARDLMAYQSSAHERFQKAQLERATAEARAEEAGAKAKAERRARWRLVGLAAALLLGAAVASWQAVVATGAKKNALAAVAAEATAKDQAREKEAETRGAFDFMENQILAAARPKGQDGGLGSTVTLRQALEAALPVVEKSFAQQPLSEARVRTALGTSFYRLGEGQISADQYARARAIYLRHLGPDHADTLRSMMQLANGYELLGWDSDAIRLREETLELQKAKLGPDHPETLTSMHNLAKSYKAHGRYKDFLKLCQKTLALRKAKLGPDDPDTLGSMSILASAYALNDQPEAALELCQETLERQKKVLSPNHPDILGSMVNLANCYHDVKQYSDALKLREETLPLLEAALPHDHPNVFWGMHNLANAYGKLERYPEALKLHQKTLARREAALSPSHPDTLRSMWAVAVNLVNVGCSADAVPVIDECLRRAAGQVVPPKLIPGVIELRLRHFEKAKDAAGCRATAEMWEMQRRTDDRSLYKAAVCRAVTADAIRWTDPSFWAAERAAAESDRAMAWLQKAVAAGFKDVTQIENDKDFDALSDRADFQTLLAELRSRN
jgi:hypothetical protein